MLLAELVGRTLVGGFSGTSLSQTMRRALERGERAGVVLFRRNLTESFAEIATLAHDVHSSSREVPFVCVDQEGGLVARLGPPALILPPARRLAEKGGIDLITRVGHVQGRELRALGFNVNFAPVLDVDSCSTNPIIGQRAYSDVAEKVAELAIAYALALQASGVLACGKHFPGHGDTHTDSHLVLPHVTASRDILEARELVPFRHAAAAGLRSLMTAHVVYEALDPDRPATISRRICEELLRNAIGFKGLLFSDDLEMKAITLPIADAAVASIHAGCDVLLICSNEEAQDEAHAALVREGERSLAFRSRLEDAARRSTRARETWAHYERPKDLAAEFNTQEARLICEALA